MANAVSLGEKARGSQNYYKIGSIFFNLVLAAPPLPLFLGEHILNDAQAARSQWLNEVVSFGLTSNTPMGVVGV